MKVSVLGELRIPSSMDLDARVLLTVTELVLRNEHSVDLVPKLGQHYRPVVVAAARLIVDPCPELRMFLGSYDDAVEDVLTTDDEIPF